MLVFLTGCKSSNSHQEKNINMEAFSDMKTPAFVFDKHQMMKSLQHMVAADSGKTLADRQARKYYIEGHPTVWIDRYGVDERADSLLVWLHLVKEMGMSERAFNVAEIEEDLKRMRTLDFTEGSNSFSQVAARLEYRLTKACLRYCYGQRYGFVNPYQVLNEIDVEKVDTVRNVTTYHQLFDVPMELPAKSYAGLVLSKVMKDSIADYLSYIQPKDRFYVQLKDLLQGASSTERKRCIMVNMERSRWRRRLPLPETGKRILVNIPAYHLYAYGDEETLDMKVVCGNVRTKTPQLTSYIERMEVNPKWNIPFSIIQKEVALRAGDSAYFARNRYRIYDKTYKEIGVRQVTQQMLQSGNYRVAQDGGAGNSLGRIIFRFKNNFSVFLHDTSNPGAFERRSRAMSHGCVRVSRPFELARFMLEDPDEWLLDRIRIAMGLTAESVQGMEYEQQHPETEERNQLIGNVPVKPRVPIFIIYYTLWPDTTGELQTWPDVYGFDKVLWEHLKPYV